MKRLINSLIISGGLILAASGCDNSEAEILTEPNTGNNPPVQVEPSPADMQYMPAFKLADAKGNIVDLSAFKGKKVFVNLWATWCPPCRAELPSIENLYAKTDREKAAFVMISFDNNFKTAVNFAEKTNMQTPVYYPAEELPALFNVQGIPATFIFDEGGKLLKHIEGASKYDTREYMEMFSK